VEDDHPRGEKQLAFILPLSAEEVQGRHHSGMEFSRNERGGDHVNKSEKRQVEVFLCGDQR